MPAPPLAWQWVSAWLAGGSWDRHTLPAFGPGLAYLILKLELLLELLAGEGRAQGMLACFSWDFGALPWPPACVGALLL